MEMESLSRNHFAVSSRRNKPLVIRLGKHTILYLLILFAYFCPADYVVDRFVDQLLAYYTLFMALVVLLYGYIAYQHAHYRVRKPVVMMILFLFWCILGSTTVNYLLGKPVEIYEALITFSYAFVLVLITDIGLSVSPKSYLGSFAFLGSIMCSLNAVTMFLYKDQGGMNLMRMEGGRLKKNYYLLSADNASFFWSWTVLIVLWVYYFRYNRSKRMFQWAVFYTALITAGYIYVWSVMAVLGCIAAIAILFFYQKAVKTRRREFGLRFKSKPTWFTVCWVIGLIFDYLMSVQMIFFRFGDFIQNVLSKSITISGRALIWMRSTMYIASAPWIGYGCEPEVIVSAKLGINHTHNLLLEVFYRGGIIGFIGFLLMLLSIGRIAKKVSNNKIYQFLETAILIFFIMTSVEFAFYRYHHWVLFALLFHAEIFQNPTNTTNELLYTASLKM